MNNEDADKVELSIGLEVVIISNPALEAGKWWSLDVFHEALVLRIRLPKFGLGACDVATWDVRRPLPFTGDFLVTTSIPSHDSHLSELDRRQDCYYFLFSI